MMNSVKPDKSNQHKGTNGLSRRSFYCVFKFSASTCEIKLVGKSAVNIFFYIELALPKCFKMEKEIHAYFYYIQHQQTITF